MKFFSVYFVPIFILLCFISCILTKNNSYKSFVSGVNGVIDLLITIFPYIVSVLVMTQLMEASGFTTIMEKLFSPLFNAFKIPPELFKLIMIKPLSGSGSLALLDEIFSIYSPDSYIGRCASCIFGSSETIFYISALYFSKCKKKKVKMGIIISLVSTFISCVFACFICSVLKP